MTSQGSIPCYHCNLTNQHLCTYCHGTGWLERNEGSGGNPIGWIIASVIIIPVAVISLISALLIALILIPYIHSIEPGSPKLAFGKAFNLLFKTTALYQLLNLITGVIMYFLVKQNIEIPFLNFQEPDPSNIYIAVLTSLLLFQVPTILLTGIIFQKRLSGYSKFKKFPGYVRATLFTGIAIMPLILVTGYVVVEAISVYIFKQPATSFINN